MVLTIEDIISVLSNHPYLPKPRHIIITFEPIEAHLDGLKLVIRGLASDLRRDTIVLSPDASDTTVVHEILHTMGFGEFGAKLFSRLLRVFRSLVPPVLAKSSVKYVKCDYCDEFRVLHEKYRGRMIHYRLVEK